MSSGESTDSESLNKSRAALPDFEIYEWRRASAVLMTDFPQEWKDMQFVRRVS
jgi:hypothetical protein